MQSRHATVSIDSMLVALQQTAAEKVCIALAARNQFDMKCMRYKNLDSLSFILGRHFYYFDKLKNVYFVGKEVRRRG